MVGSVGVGGDNPVRLQSMTTSNTRDVCATIEQIMRLSDTGCEIARVTVQGMREAEACEGIKNGLLQRGYQIPLVADIHFFPPAALRVADFVDKVRINPGNFVDKRASFKQLTYDDTSYALEIERIEEKFTPLVEKCKKLNRAMRIGTNHGSLSDRIMNRYGDTPAGMVESALEYAQVCRKLDYHELIFSMKSSNPQVMIQAYRLLTAKMMELGWDYPLHLGVTEAGEGEDGRVKSAIGIGALLLDGIGDTIRVSLTEDPWHEIDSCRSLKVLAESYAGLGVEPFIEKHRRIDVIQKRPVTLPSDVVMHRDGTVMVKVSAPHTALTTDLGCDLTPDGKPKLQQGTVDAIILQEGATVSSLQDFSDAGIGIIKAEELIDLTDYERALRFTTGSPKKVIGLIIGDQPASSYGAIEKANPAVLFLRPEQDRLHGPRRLFDWLQSRQLKIPVILNFIYNCAPEELAIRASAECGALLCDGLGDGVCLEGPHKLSTLRSLGFSILQSARMRTTRTDFISCPSCGRTLFNLQEVSARIRARTAHLPGIKIAIMGCIVNGPGEMADADFGYVGSKPGKVDLYVGKQCVEKDIDFSDADERLVALIKAHGCWVEEVTK